MKLEISHKKRKLENSQICEDQTNATEQTMDQRRNKNRNQKNSWYKWKYVLHQNGMKCSTPKYTGLSTSSSKRYVHNNKCLSQKTKEIPNKQPNFTPQATRERTKPKVNRRRK